MLLQELDHVVQYFKQRRSIGTTSKKQSLSINQPHTCRHCSSIIIDCNACREAWTQASGQANPEQPSMRGALESSGFDPTAIRLHDKFSHVIDGAADGCLFFEYLADTLIRQDDGDDLFIGSSSSDVVFCLEPKVDRGGCIFTAMPYLVNEEGQVFKSGTHHTNTLDVWTSETNAASSYLDTRPIETDKSSSISMRFAETSFRTCLSEHGLCREPRISNGQSLSDETIQDSDLPARLLHVQQGPGGLLIQLVEIKAISDHDSHEICSGGYSSLSYCWGADQPLKLTAKTHDELKAGIMTDKFPKTIQDAIQVSMSVGLKYIWIDALCILQDSQEDKEIEISRMPLYYGRNTLTISAACSKKCTEGFLDHASSLNFRAGPFQLPFCTETGSGWIQVFSLAKEGPEPIDSRGWTFQESALSRRVLVFAADQVRWHCMSGEARCGGPGATFHDLLDTSNTNYSLSSFHEGDLTLDKWNSIVRRYTSRKLTMESDKLLAISALADRMHDARRGSLKDLTYVSGLFVVPHLVWTWINQLLWLSRPNKACRPNTYRAPSWSWACLDVDDGIHNLQLLFPPLRVVRMVEMKFQVKSYSVDLSLPSARFGGVTGASLTVQGRWKRLDTCQDFKVSFPDTLTPLARILINRPSQSELFLLPDTARDGTRMDQAVAGSCQTMALLELIPPLLLPRESRPGIGLVLKETAASTFERIGVFVVFFTCDDDGQQLLDSFFKENKEEVEIV